MFDLVNGKSVSIGDTVCIVGRKTYLPISDELVVLGIAYRAGPDNIVKKFLYLSDGNGAYDSDKVRVVQKFHRDQENSNV